MGWFDEQIESRKRQELDLLSESFQDLTRSVTGQRGPGSTLQQGAAMNEAVSALLRYFNLRPKETPPTLKRLEAVLDYQLSAAGVMYRSVKLEKGWHKDAMGAMISSLKEDGTIIAILPHHTGGYVYTDPVTGKKVRVTGAAEEKISQEAYCFYRPFPQRKMHLTDLLRYMQECLTFWDLASYCICAFAITLVGMLLPNLQYLLTSTVIKTGSSQLLMAVLTFMICITVGNMLFSTVRSLLMSRIETKMNINVNAAAMMRVLSLPSDFFKQYSSGELSQYLTYMSTLCSALVSAILSTGLTGVFSLVYLFQISRFAKSLVVPALLITALTLTAGLLNTKLQAAINRQQMDLSAKERGLVYSLLTGIQKIRIAGAENRAFSKWAALYAKKATLLYRPPVLLRLNSVIVSAISLTGTLIMYFVAVKNHVSEADYIAFNASYAYISSAFSSLVSITAVAGTIRPILTLVKPLMDAQPEMEDDKETVTALSGSVEFSHVSFRYTPNSPLIIDDLTLTIPARQYVAIVGRTGCGKSTLVRLLLGFETPVKGSIFLDRKDTKRLNMRSVRKCIGTVMQDGKLFGGSIYDNIVISDPTLSVDDAWQAASVAGLEEDIHRMPMGMHTMVMEGGGGISGGQKQRLMIARAVAPKPKILLLDEATSALDNITQKKVAQALDQMKCTRIVIAHRLSTIRNCDRILVLNEGKIVEDGTYEELIALNGYFAELVARQRVDEN